MSFSAQFFGRITVVFTLFLLFFTFILPSSVSAQTATPSGDTETVESDVPMNMHTFVQSLMIEMTAAGICQLSGIDMIHPDKGCLGINTNTNKIGYNPNPSSEPQQLGGVVGAATGMVASLYTPTTSSVDYIHYVAQNFGIVKPAYAATDGFHALWPVLDLWKLIRNIAYFFLILVFIFIGLGVMLRINIDPRTVMTLQNQLPRIIIGILLITFSYAIAAVMIDIMWISTYVGINAITQTYNPTVKGCGKADQPISQVATNNLLETPVTYVNQTYSTTCIIGSSGGIWNLTTQISGSLGGMLKGIMDNLAGKRSRGCVYFFGVDIASCFSGVIGWLGTIIMFLVILATILFALFRIWYGLLRAYIYTIVYVIMGPLWIVAGLLPQKPLGFSAWWRSLFANLAVFPVTAWLLVFGRVIMAKYNEADKLLNMNMFPHIPIANAQPAVTADQIQNYYVPPLVGNSFAPDFGALIALGILLLTPNIGEILKNSLKVPDLKSPGAVSKGLTVGAAVVGAPASKAWGGLTKRNPQTHAAEAPISRGADKLKQKAAGWAADKWRLPGRKIFTNYSERAANQAATGHRVTNEEREQAHDTSRLLAESNRSGLTPKQLQAAAKRSNLSTNQYLEQRDQARQHVQQNGGDFDQILQEKIHKIHNPPQQSDQTGTNNNAANGGGTNNTGNQSHQEGEEGHQEQPQPGATVNIDNVGKVIISGAVNLDLNNEQVKTKTPQEHVESLIPEGAVRDEKISALQALQQGGENWVSSSPIGQLGTLPGGVMARFEQFMKDHFKAEEPPTGEA